jgi:outer membrane lipoprotein LolB
MQHCTAMGSDRMRILVRRLAPLALLLLAACQPLTRPAPAQPAAWAERKAELQAVNRWRFEGRFAIAGVETGGSAGIRWQQADAHSEVAVFGALGAGAMHIELDGDRLHVETRRGERVEGEQASATLAERLGAPVPFTQLRYWLLGVPAPGTQSSEVLGENQRLASLSQEGWDVRFSEYSSVGGDVLPARVDAMHGKVRVKLRISRWDWRRP